LDKQRVFLTGATGCMGFASMKEMLKDSDKQDIVILVRSSEKNRKLLKPFMNTQGLIIVWGDLTDYRAVRECVRDCDLILHIAAFVSPAADYYPRQAMEVNYGSTRNLINAVFDLGQEKRTRFVYIGTVAETGDRMPPIHWGRVGDPVKPSIFDYYAVSKVAAERLVIESGLKYWVSLRQTGIIGSAMSKIDDAIIFHNCFDNVLEYCSDRDSARAMRHLCAYFHDGTLSESFWGHIYNIGGGESCRVDTYTMYRKVFGAIGLDSLDLFFSPRKQAIVNFHGQYYLDSDKLENYLHFRQDSMQYFYDSYMEELGAVRYISKAICRLPGGQKLMGSILRVKFDRLARTEHGTLRFIEENMEGHIEAYWGSRERWEALPEKLSDMKHFSDWDTVIAIDHGYDEGKPESELNWEDMNKAAQFRGGRLISRSMIQGDWSTKLEFECAFGHRFKASPRLVLEGGHWCDECERKSWNYGNRAKTDLFFAQVWNPLHEETECREYPKIVSELDVK
jgi:nucleoside-diphosphate-sugar epimerase